VGHVGARYRPPRTAGRERSVPGEPGRDALRARGTGR
jgi:hypothetical protein